MRWQRSGLVAAIALKPAFSAAAVLQSTPLHRLMKRRANLARYQARLANTGYRPALQYRTAQVRNALADIILTSSEYFPSRKIYQSQQQNQLIDKHSARRTLVF